MVREKKKEKPRSLSPWLWILFTAPLPLFLLGYLGYQWRSKTAKLGLVEEQFLERQNSVLAHDAEDIAAKVSKLLASAANDVRTLALLPESSSTRRQFMQLRKYRVFGPDAVENPTRYPMGAPGVRYNRALVLNMQSEKLQWYWEPDPKVAPLKTLSECSWKNLCDRALLEEVARLPDGSLRYGKALRYYTPKGTTPDDDRAGLSVAYRDNQHIYLLAIDYRHLWNLLSEPSFPYATKRDWLRAYEAGNYVYLVDRSTDMLVHPKTWHVAGVDRETGEMVPPMKEDADEGRHPLNLLGYKLGNLRPYFDRLLNESFPRNSVDIFEGRNLGGTSRVLSVVPVFLREGQFEKNGLFGHLIVGCALDYFREPKEKRLPYY